MSYLYQGLSQELISHIEKGVYRPGDRMPGVRQLSEQRDISVSTAIAAYRELETRGYLEARNRSGFYVRLPHRHRLEEPGQSRPGRKPAPVNNQELALRMVQSANDQAMIQLGAAVPHSRYLPLPEIEKSMLKVVRQHRVLVNSYQFPPGLPALRLQLARRLSEWGCQVAPDEIIITDGCQEALALSLRALTSPGDVVALESPCYYGLLQLLDTLGLKALEIPTHPRDGISLEALQLALEQWPVKVCIAVPSFSNPLGYCMSDNGKQQLVKLLAKHRVPLLEDDVYGDLHFGSQRPVPAKRWDQAGNNLICGSFAKSLSPGLRIGWVAAGKYRPQMDYLKFVNSVAAPTLPQIVVAEWLERGLYERALKKSRVDYANAVERMLNAVEKHFPDDTRITRPQGGFLVWVELPDDIDCFQLAQDALQNGISIAPGTLFSASGKFRNFMRLSAACKDADTLDTALSRLARLIARQGRR